MGGGEGGEAHVEQTVTQHPLVEDFCQILALPTLLFLVFDFDGVILSDYWLPPIPAAFEGALPHRKGHLLDRFVCKTVLLINQPLINTFCSSLL